MYCWFETEPQLESASLVARMRSAGGVIPRRTGVGVDWVAQSVDGAVQPTAQHGDEQGELGQQYRMGGTSDSGGAHTSVAYRPHENETVLARQLVGW